MKDIHSLSGGDTPAAARLFAAAAAAGDRHLGLHHHLSNQALKCPRCDSLNTKFCYYNNYNLSQPRHFCKSCRRYWTKGGVLRNVPVGGGCRKSRRSSSSKSSSSKPPPSPSHSTAKPKPLDDSATTSAANNNHSSSDSSTHTAATPTEIPTPFHVYGSTFLENSTTVPATETLYGVVDITLDLPISSGVGRDDVSTSMLTEIGNFTGLLGSTAEITTFGFGEVLTQHDPPQQQPHQEQEMVVVEGFGPLDWQGGEDENRGEGLFDMTVAVDHAYWSQHNQWTTDDVEVDHRCQQQQQQQQQGRGGLFLP